MRFLHLSDLHLGKSVNNYSMIDDQRYMLDEVLNIIDKKNLDAVLISGDVYDKMIASTEAIKLYDYFILELVKRNLKVITISGNHDSAVRLGSGADLIKLSGVYISKEFNGDVNPVTLSDDFGEVNFYMLPFIKPIHVKQTYNLPEQLSYTDSVKYVVDKMNIDTSKRNVILSHQFVVGADLSGSEEIITVGGVDNVNSEAYKDFDYVALGHIHRAQDVVKDKIRYCGTLLKYSFSEVNNKKTLTIVDLKEKGNLSIEEIEVYPKRDFAELKGKYKDLTKSDFYNQVDRDKYYRIILTDEEELVDVFKTLSDIYPNIMAVLYDNKRTQINNIINGASDVETKKPIELIDEFYLKQNNDSLNDRQKSYLDNKISKIWEDRA